MIDKNTIVWITGASSGIGESLAYAFAERGCTLILSARNTSALETVKRNCITAKSIEIVPLDLSKHDLIDEIVKQTVAKVGHIDILVNNAGISQRSLVADTSFEVDKSIINTNLLGTIALTKALLPSMLSRQKGHFVVISSVMGKIGTPLRSAYAASKHGLHGFFDSLRAELHKSINVTIVCPGYVRTDISQNALTEKGLKQGTMDKATEQGLPPQYVAAKILKAIGHNKQEVYIGRKEVLTIYLKRFFPSLLSIMVSKIKTV
ncbi:MAG: SDR family oxidoreductase [Saprospiraceae bacterium]|nr:SDR family oxidoreductase [Saprospiraceae bacterium]